MSAAVLPPDDGPDAAGAVAEGGSSRLRSSESKRAAALSVIGVVARMALPSLVYGLPLIWPLSAQWACWADASAAPCTVMASGCSEGSCSCSWVSRPSSATAPLAGCSSKVARTLPSTLRGPLRPLSVLSTLGTTMRSKLPLGAAVLKLASIEVGPARLSWPLSGLPVSESRCTTSSGQSRLRFIGWPLLVPPSLMRSLPSCRAWLLGS